MVLFQHKILILLDFTPENVEVVSEAFDANKRAEKARLLRDVTQ